ncbi:SET domain-containing protein [Apiospora kogelbergensis]|uniref:SET domain-containing protein n=1 Tax=Apiospora kogelbergensis TaxID=1337665 RepID=A0AAW0QQA6_9PEZI
MAATTPEPLWEVQRIPNKGYGVIATAPIEPGTRILVEKPLYTRPMTDDPIPRQNSIVESLVQSLPGRAQRDAFHGLASSFDVLYPDHPYYSIATTNEVVLSGAQDGGGVSGLFLRWSRFNHACAPSAYWAWHDEGALKGALTVHAIRRIQPGDEISISYFENRVMPHDDRERYLAEIYCFACDCALCSLAPGPWRDDVDERLERLAAFWRKYHLGEANVFLIPPPLPTHLHDHPTKPTRSPPQQKQKQETGLHKTSAAICKILKAASPSVAKQPRLSSKLRKTSTERGGGGEDGDIGGCIDITFVYEIALALTLVLGDAARAAVFAARNQARYALTSGADCVSALRAGRCARNPRADRSFGALSSGGKRIIRSKAPDVDEIEEEAFEEWLWSAEDW